MDRPQHRGGRRRAATAAPVRLTAGLVWRAVSLALLVGAVALGIACVVLPKALGAVPLTILSGSMAPGMPPGALAIVRPVDATHARIGDVLTYQPRPDDPMLVTHRVVAVSQDHLGDVSLTLQGDANDAPDERSVRPDQVQGSVVYAVPYVGWVAHRLHRATRTQRAHEAAWALIAVGVLRIIGARPGRGARTPGVRPSRPRPRRRPPA